MVKKGTYHVQDPEGGQPAVEDTSYKSFLCVLLIFISFCVVIIVFSSFNWFKTKEKQPLEVNGDVEMVDKGKLMQGKESEGDRAKESDKEVDENEATTKSTKKEYTDESNEIGGLYPTTSTTLRSSTSSATTTSSLSPQTTTSSTSITGKSTSSTTTSTTTESTLGPSSTTLNTTTSILTPQSTASTLSQPTTTTTTLSSTTTSSLSPETTKSSTTTSSLSPQVTVSSTNTTTLSSTTTTSTTTSSLSPQTQASSTTTSTSTPTTTSGTTTSTLSPTTTSGTSTTTSTLSPITTLSTSQSTSTSSTTTSTMSPTTISSTTTSTLSPTTTSGTTTSTLSPTTTSGTTTSTLSPTTTSGTTTSALSPITTSSTSQSTLSPTSTSSTTTSTLSPTTISSTTTSTLSPTTISSTTTSTLSPTTTSSTTTSTLSPAITTSSSQSPQTTTSSTTSSTLSQTTTSTPTTTTLGPQNTTLSTTSSTLSATAASNTVASSLIQQIITSTLSSSTTTSTSSTTTTSSTTASSLIPPTTISSTTTTTLSPTTTNLSPTTTTLNPTTTTLSPPATTLSAPTTTSNLSPTTTLSSSTTASSTTTSTLSPTTTPSSSPIPTTLSSSTTASSTSSTSTVNSSSDDYHTDVDSTETLINKISRSVQGIVVTDITNNIKTTTTSTTLNDDDDFDLPQEPSGEDYVDLSSKSASSTSTTTSSTSSTSTTTAPAKTAMNKKSSGPQQKASARLKNKFKISVSDMLATMDHTIDKCEDFYSYSCGRSSTKSSDSFRRQKMFRTILNEEARNPAKRGFVEKMTQFYETCIRHESVFDYNERLTEVREIIEKLINDDPEKHEFTILISKMILTNTLPIMDVDIDVDPTTKRYVFKLSPPYKTLTRNPLESGSALYNIDSNCAKKLQREQRFESNNLNLDQIYKDYANCVQDFDHYITSFNVTRRSIEYLNNIYNLEFNIENEILDYTKQVNTSALRNSFISQEFEEQTLDDLNKEWWNIDWKLLFKIISRKELDESSVVFVYQKNILYNIFRELNKLQIKGSYVNFLAVYTNDLFHSTVIPKSTDSIDDYCLDLANYLFSDVSSYLYMKRLSQEKITKAQELSKKIFDKLKSNFLESVENTEGIDEETDKELIKEKITKLSLNFMADSDECISDLFLHTKYDSINSGSSYVSQLIEMRNYKNLQKYSSVGETFEDTDTFCHFIQPQDYKPKSFYFTSKISIPYEFLTSYNLDYYPGYFLMAKIGTQIAIEMGKHFNQIGIKTMGLTGTDILDVLHTEQDKKFIVVREQNITITPPEIKYIQTDADNTGLHLALKSFNQLQTNNTVLPWINNDFTEEQIFLIATAQEFCEERIISNENHLDFMLKMFEAKNNLPNSWRVNKMIINAKEFRTIFKCSIGSTMATNDVVRKAFPFDDDDDY